MTYETIDWDAEAQRVARAFGIAGECRFVEHSRVKGARRLSVMGVTSRRFTMAPNAFLRITYTPRGRHFSLSDATQDKWLSLRIGWDENELADVGGRITDTFRLILTRGTFLLDLLTPDVENKLKTTLTAHQKLEWQLEYEERYDF